METPERESMSLNFGPFRVGSEGRSIPKPEIASHDYDRRPFERKQAAIVSCDASHQKQWPSEEKREAIVCCEESHHDQRRFEQRQRVVAADGLRVPVTEVKHHRHSSAYIPAVPARHLYGSPRPRSSTNFSPTYQPTNHVDGLIMTYRRT